MDGLKRHTFSLDDGTDLIEARTGRCKSPGIRSPVPSQRAPVINNIKSVARDKVVNNELVPTSTPALLGLGPEPEAQRFLTRLVKGPRAYQRRTRSAFQFLSLRKPMLLSEVSAPFRWWNRLVDCAEPGESIVFIYLIRHLLRR